MCRRVRGCAQRLCRQYKDCVGGQSGVKVCSCQTAHTCLQSFYQHVILPEHHLSSSKPFLATCWCAKVPCKPREPLNLQRLSPKFPLASDAGSNRGSFEAAGRHAEALPCRPHPHCGKEGCSAGWSRQDVPSHPPALPVGLVRTSEPQARPCPPQGPG